MDERKLEHKNVVRPTEQLIWASVVLLSGDHESKQTGRQNTGKD